MKKKVIIFISIIFAICINGCSSMVDDNYSAYEKEAVDRNVKQDKSMNILEVPIICQMPELKNGCEVTSLAMLLQYKGINIDKMTLCEKMIKDDTKIVEDEEGNIITWGNPSNGFVGDVYGNEKGYSISVEAIIPLAKEYYKKGVNNLTGDNIKKIEKSLSQGNPVLVWVTADFIKNPQWVQWKDRKGNVVKATFSQHAIVLTGYDKTYFYYNDPIDGGKNKTVRKQDFIDVWNLMANKALSLK